jgi:hypothetical protein
MPGAPFAAVILSEVEGPAVVLAVLKGHDFSRAANAENDAGLQPLSGAWFP